MGYFDQINSEGIDLITSKYVSNTAPAVSNTKPSVETLNQIQLSQELCYLDMLDKLQKRICGTVGSSLAASLEALAHRRNIASLRLLCSYYLGRRSSELAELIQPPRSRGRSTLHSIKLLDFLSPFLDVIRMAVPTVSFLTQLSFDL